MLKPITNWSMLRHALEGAGKEIFLCAECAHLFLSKSTDTPVRCPNQDCRALANSPKRDRVGKPSTN